MPLTKVARRFGDGACECRVLHLLSLSPRERPKGEVVNRRKCPSFVLTVRPGRASPDENMDPPLDHRDDQHRKEDGIARMVVGAQAGSAVAFAELHRRFVPLVHGILLSRFPTSIADELTQECFLLAFQRLPQLREPASFGAWIAAIARRMRSSEPARQLWLEDVAEPADSSAGPEEYTDADAVLAAIRRLPPAYRETLMLRLVEGLSGPEIAAATGLGADSVRVNLHRGMQKLRESLALVPARALKGEQR